MRPPSTRHYSRSRSSADSPRIPAVAICQGTPVRNEIEARGVARLAEATDVATAAIAGRFGWGAVDGKIQFIGSVKVRMTDFKIQPPNPSFAGGAIKTGDEVTLRFHWWVNRVGTNTGGK